MGLHATPGDASSTQRYVSAVVGFARVEAAQLKSSELAAATDIAAISGRCRGILARAPQNGALDTEILGATYVATQEPIMSAKRVYIRELAHLSWPDKKLTLLVQQEVRQERAIVRLRLPNLCADARRWSSRGYRNVPLATTRFSQQFEALIHEHEPHAEIHRLLPRFATKAEVNSLKRALTMEAHANSALEHTWLTAVATIRRVLGLKGT